MTKLRLSFGEIVTAQTPDGFELIPYVAHVLQRSPTYEASQYTKMAFRNVNVLDVEGEKWLVATYAIFQGKNYKSLNPDTKEIESSRYATPPFKGESIVLIDSSGHLIVERKSHHYLAPAKVVGAIERELRQSAAFQWYVTAKLVGLEDRHASILTFMKNLRVLNEVRLTNLRHSNPRRRSELLDRIAKQRVTELTQASRHADGIDREDEEFENMLAHVEHNYAHIARVSGLSESGFQILESDTTELTLTIDVNQADVEDKVRTMVRAFRANVRRLDSTESDDA